MSELPELTAASALVVEQFRNHGMTMGTAESCTGGMILASLTDIAGCSDVVDRGYVTYSNQAKQDMLGVPSEMLAEHGAVSSEVAAAMASGVLEHSDVDASVAVTGIAGPSGGSDEKPVGLVFIAVASRQDGVFVEEFRFDNGGRDFIRRETVLAAYEMLLSYGISDDEDDGETEATMAANPDRPDGVDGAN